ncbi:hypothetical protein L7F22_009530 [Adiantum nelumboides]|nr:hypothetical protein [Adiantum nelumboides]
MSRSRRHSMPERRFRCPAAEIQKYDTEKAQLKEMELRVETLAENELKFKERRERFEQLIESKQKQIENRKQKADEIEQAHHDRMQSLESHFQNDIKIFEATSAARLKRWRQQLQENEKRLEEERVKRLKEIEGLQNQFQSVRQDIKQKEAQKAVAKELEVMQRKENFMAEMARAETTFNERARKQESELQAKQHLEEMKLMEELKRERENLLQEWLEKQKNVKKEEERPVQEEASECCSCMDALDEHNRAFLRPCGHAKICLECALSVYKSPRALCPFCRQKISKKPTLLPKYYI